MKVMHNAPSDVRVKFWKFLEKEDKELVHLSYGTANEDEKRFYVGIAYLPQNNNGGDYSPNRYDVVVYDLKFDGFEYCSQNLNYENALIEMGRLIRKSTYENN